MPSRSFLDGLDKWVRTTPDAVDLAIGAICFRFGSASLAAAGLDVATTTRFRRDDRGDGVTRHLLRLAGVPAAVPHAGRLLTAATMAG